MKETVHDPQGEAICQSLQHMGYAAVHGVRQGKIFDIEIDGMNGPEVRPLLEEIAHKVLANPIIEQYFIEVGDES